MSCSGTNSFCEEKSDFSTGDFAEATTDPSRWRLFSDGGRNVWHYLTRDEDIQKWPQTAVDRYHLGLSTGFPKVEPAITPMQSVINAVSVYSKLQLPSGHWACEEGGPLFLLPGLVITWFVTEASIPEAFKIEIKNYLFARQNADDGSWGLHIEAEGSVFGLAMNYTALRLLGVRADHQRLCKARSELHRLGGALNAPHWAKFWLSVLGVMPWDIVNPVPPELWLLPDWVPFAPWRWWIHIRQVFLPMSWVWSRRWQYPLCDLTRDIRQELFVQPPELIDFSVHRNSISPRDNYHSKSWLLNTANWLIVNIWNPYLRHDKLRTAAEAWVYDLIQHEDENTEYVNLGPVNAPMNTLVCYIQQGPKSTAMARHLDHLMDYLWKKDEGMLMNGTNGAQVWDTAFSIQAIVDTGLADDPRYQPTLMKALEFLEEHQIRDDCREQGICYRHYRKGAWPFSTRQQGYTVTDCTAEGLKSVLALQSIPGYPNIVTEDRLCDAVNILLSMQNNTGGCSSYELRRGSEHLEYLNAAEVFGQIMVEYDYVECTAACMLALDKFRKVNPFYRALEIENFIQRAIKFIRSAQRDDGSWYGSWGICFTYGTMFALEALEAVGDTWHNSESIRCACEYLLAHQREDGGWGESFRGCELGFYVDHKDTQIVQTAWACIGLMQAGYPDMEPIVRGIRMIMARQQSDGQWAQEALEGVFNKSGMISYTNYKYIFPIKALGLFARKYGNINAL